MNKFVINSQKWRKKRHISLFKKSQCGVQLVRSFILFKNTTETGGPYLGMKAANVVHAGYSAFFSENPSKIGSSRHCPEEQHTLLKNKEVDCKEEEVQKMKVIS